MTQTVLISYFDHSYRQAANLASAQVDIKVDGDNWTIKTTSTFKNSEIKFKLGEEFEEERQDGVKGMCDKRLYFSGSLQTNSVPSS